MEIMIDFNAELMKMVYDESNNDDDTTEVCLIDGLPLETNFIQLKCSHKFNYYNIFNEVIRQKTKYNHKEVQHLRSNQIKCPYCRNVQTGILPFFEGYTKIKNVNTPEKYVMKNNKCSYIFKSGKRKGLPCNKNCYHEMCKTHLKITKNTLSKKQKKIIYNIGDDVPSNKCKHILTSGKNKGKYCSCKLKINFLNYGFCGKHIKKHI